MERLPADILADILSRLPINTILQSKSVSKTWLRLLSGTPFAKLHLSRSPTSLMIQHEVEIRLTEQNFNPFEVRRESPDPGFLTIVQVEDEMDRHKIGHDPLLKLDLSLGYAFQKSQLRLAGSVNGWLCLQQYTGKYDTLICNPLTHEYMILPRPKYYRKTYAIFTCGFGFSLVTGEYKVVRLFWGDVPQDSSGARLTLKEAEVYTLGTGKWRRLGHVPYLLSVISRTFLNGCVHCFVLDEDSPEGLCSFDMETESFQLFPSPPKEENRHPKWNYLRCLGVIRGCLCQCNMDESSELDFWLMKEYGIKKSWTKDIVIKINNDPEVPKWLASEAVYVIKGLKDGTILFGCQSNWAFSYSQETKQVDRDSGNFTHLVDAIDYVPSFVRLGSYELENVHVF